MTLFTGKGDGGDTSLFGLKERIAKDSCQTEALGSLDEINTLLGVCKAKSRQFESTIGNRSISNILEETQQDIFTIQAVVAGAPKELKENKVKFLEDIIGDIEKDLPKIETFFLSGGTELSGFLDYARAVSRRTERVLVAHSKETETPKEILQYLNRLSSLLYAFVRFVNHKQGVKEIPPSY